MRDTVVPFLYSPSHQKPAFLSDQISDAIIHLKREQAFFSLQKGGGLVKGGLIYPILS
jgi:hypothetical protein